MTSTQASTESWKSLVDSGLLSERRRQVYTFLCENWSKYLPGVSRTDVKLAFNDMSDSYCRRLTELAELGLARCVGTKVNPDTGQNVDAYLPVEMSIDELRARLKEVRVRKSRDVEVARIVAVLRKRLCAAQIEELVRMLHPKQT